MKVPLGDDVFLCTDDGCWWILLIARGCFRLETSSQSDRCEQLEVKGKLDGIPDPEIPQDLDLSFAVIMLLYDSSGTHTKSAAAHIETLHNSEITSVKALHQMLCNDIFISI